VLRKIFKRNREKPWEARQQRIMRSFTNQLLDAYTLSVLSNIGKSDELEIDMQGR